MQAGRMLLLAVIVVVILGCGESAYEPLRGERSVSPGAFGVDVGTPAPPVKPETTAPPSQPPTDDAQSNQNATTQPAIDAPSVDPITNEPAEDAPRIDATAGVGKKGRDYQPGLLTTPIAAMFNTQQRLVLDVTIPHTMQIYKAINGNAPKSHEEFMEKIIKENSIQLPELPDGHRYVYDPKTEKLMVEIPR